MSSKKQRTHTHTHRELFGTFTPTDQELCLRGVQQIVAYLFLVRVLFFSNAIESPNEATMESPGNEEITVCVTVGKQSCFLCCFSAASLALRDSFGVFEMYL